MKYIPLMLGLMLPVLSACDAPAGDSQTTQTTVTTQTTEPAAQSGSQAAPATPAPEAAAPAATSACMETIKKDGLRVITSPDYPPYEFTNENNEIVGYEIDLVKLLASKMGVEPKIEGQGFEGLIPSLLAGRADMIAAGMSVTEERKKSVAFSDSYNNTKNVIIAPTSSADIKDSASLNGRTVAVQSGSLQEVIAQGIEGAQVKSFGLATDAVMAVKTGQAESMIVDEEVASGVVKSYPELHVAAELGAEQTAFAVNPNCGELVTALNTALQTVQQSGELETLKSQWFK
ncbi:transporter substrate-binding domain-containing protein [Deinococcus lacus]|uniref:Transporter substrate-binding domain-containing protein n=1 Tax=Deinococcus lacus TaxID=392561 RepID=A0ABW1YFK2_9DEIO